MVIHLNEYSVDIVSRAAWEAKEPRSKSTKLSSLPPKYVIVSHTGLSTSCSVSKPSNCAGHVKAIQTRHQTHKGYNDIAYNFLVGSDGKVYEGRGFDVEGEHTIGYNNNSIGLAFIGEFEYKIPTQRLFDTAKSFLNSAVQLGKLANDYKLIAEKQLTYNTNSPGKNVIGVIETWPHWVGSP